jgi:hypothetical protein
MNRMFSEGRVDDLRRASTDSAYLNQLLAEQGLLGAFTGGITATAGGIAAAILFGYLFALLARPQTKM